MFFVLIVGQGLGLAADNPFTLQSGRIGTAPTLDGVVDEKEWEGAGRVSGFVQFTPNHGEPSPFPTTVWFGYDDDSVYIAFRCVDPEPHRISAAVTTRDGGVDNDDSVGFILDTFDDDHTGYFFLTNLLGTQHDGRLADNGRSDDDRWDARWQSVATRTDDGWSAEFAIPFSVLKFRDGEDKVWGVNFVRWVPRSLEVSTWAGPVEAVSRVSQAGSVTGLSLPKIQTKRWGFIPYALGTVNAEGESNFELGGTVRYRASSTLFAEATINPDFAIIEADVERVNLSRFELSVPEKRPFFMEGNEKFSQRIRQFYSRRIGEIPWGAKATGTVGRTDYVVLTAQSDPEARGGDVGLQGNDATYTVGRVQQGVFGSSNVGLLLANRRYGDENTGSVGVDSTLFFSDTLGMTAQFLRVHGGENDGGLAWFVRPAFDSATTHFHVRYTNLDEGIKDAFNTVGFMRDDNRREFDTNFSHTFWFEDKTVENIEGSVNYNRYWGQDSVLRSYETDAEVSVQFASKWFAEIEYEDGFERFEKDFWNQITTVEAGYDTRAGRALSVGVGDGVNFDSDLRLYTAEARFRFSDSWNASYELTRLILNPDPDDETTWIHVLSSDYYFTNDLFVKLFLQTNSAISKENVQALFVWRFKPPFGSLQVAYQRGTSELGEESTQDDTLFTKLSWVF
ncbi:MAG: carbohydrate binding family 9 domain-containing protein [bacterium]|nr:carbohydrate binding family 9 domain-containing protein [bacterium]